MIYEVMFAIDSGFGFISAVVMFGIVAIDVAVQAFKAHQRGVSRREAVRGEFRTFKVAIALAYGVIFLTRSQLR